MEVADGPVEGEVARAGGLFPPSSMRLAPPRPRLEPVVRPRLLRRTAGAVDGAILVIHGPPGYGKSTLLGQLFAQDARATAWLSLDARDDDPAVLLYDLAHALGGVRPVGDVVMAHIEAGALQRALAELISALAGSEALLLVLDDVHHLRSAACLDILRSICGGLPAGVSVALSGRIRPMIPLARLRSEGRVWELEAADLKMTSAEGAAMLRAAGVDISDQEAAIIVQRAEGWPAAMYLVGLMLRDDRDPEEVVDRLGVDAGIADYFYEEVLSRIPPKDAAFLVDSSILDELRPRICDTVLQRSDSGDVLRRLAHADLFVTRNEATASAYHVHGLFREMLAGEMQRVDPDRGQRLHQRACESYQEAEDWERAMRHAIAAGEPGTAADLLWLLMPEHVSRGRAATISRWYSWLTPEQVAAHPQAALARGWVAFEEGDPVLPAHAVALARGAAEPDRTLVDGSPLSASALLLRAALGQQGTDRARQDAMRAEAALAPDNPLRAISLLIMGSIAMLEDDADQALAWLEEGESLAAGALPSPYAQILAQRALLAAEHDHWGQAESLLRRAQARVPAANVSEFATMSLVAAALALVLAHGGHAAEASAEIQRARRALKRLGCMAPWYGAQARVVLGCAYVALGDHGHGRVLLREAREMADAPPPPGLARWIERLERHIEGFLADGGEVESRLTGAELATLQQLTTHRSLREIGEHRHVTRNTVKTHTIAIYRKLGASSRSEAVDRARELGLID